MFLWEEEITAKKKSDFWNCKRHLLNKKWVGFGMVLECFTFRYWWQQWVCSFSALSWMLPLSSNYVWVHLMCIWKSYSFDGTSCGASRAASYLQTTAWILLGYVLMFIWRVGVVLLYGCWFSYFLFWICNFYFWLLSKRRHRLLQLFWNCSYFYCRSKN